MRACPKDGFEVRVPARDLGEDADEATGEVVVAQEVLQFALGPCDTAAGGGREGRRRRRGSHLLSLGGDGPDGLRLVLYVFRRDDLPDPVAFGRVLAVGLSPSDMAIDRVSLKLGQKVFGDVGLGDAKLRRRIRDGEEFAGGGIELDQLVGVAAGLADFFAADAGSALRHVPCCRWLPCDQCYGQSAH